LDWEEVFTDACIVAALAATVALLRNHRILRPPHAPATKPFAREPGVGPDPGVLNKTFRAFGVTLVGINAGAFSWGISPQARALWSLAGLLAYLGLLLYGLTAVLRCFGWQWSMDQRTQRLFGWGTGIALLGSVLSQAPP